MVVRLLLALTAGVLCAAEKPVDFDRDVRPILSDNCFACHGPDDKHRMANLRLDTEQGVRQAYVTPGDPAKSRLLRRASAPRIAPSRMPPPQAGPRRSPKRRSRPSANGSSRARKWERHWAFVPPERPALPAGRNREVGAQSDRPLRAGAPGTRRAQAVAGSRPRHPAAPPQFRPHRTAAHPRRDRRLPRRQIARRLREAGRPPARLPQYGERMAMQWLDLARYADTHGYHIDSAARHVEVARLGDRRLQPQHAVRPLRHRATGRRPAAQRHRAAEAGQRLQPQPHDQLRRRRDPRGVPGGVRGRPRGHHVQRVSWG